MPTACAVIVVNLKRTIVYGGIIYVQAGGRRPFWWCGIALLA